MDESLPVLKVSMEPLTVLTKEENNVKQDRDRKRLRQVQLCIKKDMEEEPYVHLGNLSATTRQHDKVLLANNAVLYYHSLVKEVKENLPTGSLTSCLRSSRRRVINPSSGRKFFLCDRGGR